MKVDEIFPHVVGDRSTLKERLLRSALDRGISQEDTEKVLADIPEPILDAGAFLDKMTGLWRYEFGIPFTINGSYVWGAHMWIPVDHLDRAIATARQRLIDTERAIYYARLNDIEKHAETLAEMIPGNKISKDVASKFEASGYGVGNTTIDWVFQLPDRRVLLEVKSRSKDFIEQISNKRYGNAMPEPDHDPALLFQSVEKKLKPADPDETLQGVWIGTHLQQHASKLNGAFAALDSTKVHFAILGDWESDIHVLVGRDKDREFLYSLFNAHPSSRFTFMPSA